MNERFLTTEQKAASSKRAKEDKLCRWCGLDVHRLNPKRRSFCSPECVHEFSLRSSSSYVRHYIAKRDNYVCQICGLDCKGFVRRFNRFIKPHRWAEPKIRRELEEQFFRSEGSEWTNLNGRSTYYDVDHIVPVSLGQGQCGEENLRTVCLSCHRKETAKLRKKCAKSV